MSDLIRREDAIKAVAKYISCDYPTDSMAEEDAKDLINTIPSAAGPQGEWINMGDFEQCSVCKGTRPKEFQSYYGKMTWIKTPYCPSCGARMKGASDVPI